MDYRHDFEDASAHTSLGDLHYMHHSGEGKSLLFLHGLGGSTMSWSRLVEYLPTDMDVTLLDMLGHGASDAPHVEYTVNVQFQALREFLALRNETMDCIVGHSYGGWVTAYYASQQRACKSIVLIDSAGLKESFDQLAASGAKDEYLEHLVRLSMRNAENHEYVIRSMVKADPREYQLTREMLAQVHVPALIVWGDADPLIDKRFAGIFAENITGSKMEIITGARHNPHFTAPSRVASLISNFASDPDAIE